MVNRRLHMRLSDAALIPLPVAGLVPSGVCNAKGSKPKYLGTGEDAMDTISVYNVLPFREVASRTFGFSHRVSAIGGVGKLT